VTPILRTPRLTMRAFTVADFPAFAALYASERSRLIGGPIERKAAWRVMAMLAGEWTLRGYGMWSLELADGTWGGHAGFFHPDHYAEPELGWTLSEAAEGKGLALEAAVAARDWGRANGIARPISNIDVANERSIRLAERMGALREATHSEDGDSWHVYRHAAGAA
jgi:RimJ/RimL family protein N-acetyltransferase